MRDAINTVLGLGYLRPAPGTWASVVTVVVSVALYQAGLGLAVVLLAIGATLLGFWSLSHTLRDRPEDDPSEVVIDEVAGQALALCFTFIPLYRHDADIFAAWPGFIVPLVLFRLFDILKPGPIGRADRMGGATGVMLDDLLAGLFAGLGALALAGIYHVVLAL